MDHQQEMYGESKGHVIDDVTSHSRHPNMFVPIISKTSGDTDSVIMDNP